MEPTEADKAKARDIALPHFGMMSCTSTAQKLYEQAWDRIAQALADAREQGREEERTTRTVRVRTVEPMPPITLDDSDLPMGGEE